MSDLKLGWVREIDYRGNSPRWEVVKLAEATQVWLTVEDIGPGAATLVNWDEPPRYMYPERQLMVTP